MDVCAVRAFGRRPPFKCFIGMLCIWMPIENKSVTIFSFWCVRRHVKPIDVIEEFLLCDFCFQQVCIILPSQASLGPSPFTYLRGGWGESFAKRRCKNVLYERSSTKVCKNQQHRYQANQKQLAVPHLFFPFNSRPAPKAIPTLPAGSSPAACRPRPTARAGGGGRSGWRACGPLSRRWESR